MGSLFPLFVVGLLGSVHCAGMCGGIVGALSVAPALGRPVPVPVRAAMPPRPALTNVLAYNLGRIGSYMTAGAVAGALAAGGARWRGHGNCCRRCRPAATGWPT